MRKKEENMQQNSSSSVAMEASLDYTYLKTLNNELSKEIAGLRKNDTRKQSDIDHLLSEKFDIEFKYNQLYHLFLKIEERSRVTLNHIVECSNELAHIMHITNRVKSLGNRLSDSPVVTNRKSKENSYRQVVTPHAVNGHVIHTPTIRIARYSEHGSGTRPNDSVNNATGQNFEDDDLSNEGEVIENDEQIINEEEDPDEDADENVDEGPLRKSIEQLSPIQEELEESVDQQEMGQTVISGIFQEVKIYLNRISEKDCVNNKRGSNNSSSDFSDLDRSHSSVVPEASTSYNVTAKFNDDTFDEGNFAARKSLIERKSIGSPIPSKKFRRIKPKRRSSGRMSFDSSSTPRSSMENTLTNDSPSRFKGSIDHTVNDSNTSDAAVSSLISVPTIKSFIEKTSIHSTPSIDSTNPSTSIDDATTPVLTRVNYRKKPMKKLAAIPVVHLTRLEDSSREDIENVDMRLKKSAKSRKRNREDRLSDDKSVKREKADTKGKKMESKSKSPSSPKKSLSEEKSSRPKRAMKPISFKEPSLHTKMRRSR